MDLIAFFLIFGYQLNRVIALLMQEEGVDDFEITPDEAPLCRLGYGFMMCTGIKDIFTYAFGLKYQQVEPILGQTTLEYVEIENGFESHGFFLHHSKGMTTYYGSYGGVPYYVVRKMPTPQFWSLYERIEDPRFYYILTSGNPEMEVSSPEQLRVISTRVYHVTNPRAFSTKRLKRFLDRLIDAMPESGYQGQQDDLIVLNEGRQLLE